MSYKILLGRVAVFWVELEGRVHGWTDTRQQLIYAAHGADTRIFNWDIDESCAANVSSANNFHIYGPIQDVRNAWTAGQVDPVTFQMLIMLMGISR